LIDYYFSPVFNLKQQEVKNKTWEERNRNSFFTIELDPLHGLDDVIIFYINMSSDKGRSIYYVLESSHGWWI